MQEGSKGRALNTSSSLRKRVVPSKHFEDIFLERQPCSKKENLETGQKLTCKSGETPASSSIQSLLPVSISPGDTLRSGRNSSALPQLFSKSSMLNKDGCEGTCKVSESTLSTVSEASEHVGHRKKQAKPRLVVPCKDQDGKALGTSSGTQVIKLCSPEHRESEEISQTPMDSAQQAPKVKKAPKKKVAPQGNHQKSSDLKQRLEIATILLQLAQQVPDLVPEAGCTINFQQQLQLIQECSSKGNQNISCPKLGKSVKAHQEESSGLKGCSKKHHSLKKHGQKRKHLGSLDSGPVRGPEWMAARDREDMFFPHLEDSSLMAEAKERKRREIEQESSLRQMVEPLEERYLKNAAVLPDLRPQPPVAPSPVQSSSLLSAALGEPPLIHGHSIKDYQAIYHSVVDPLYNLGMGHAIKQRLWEKMSCPTLVETVDADGRVHITESFSTPSLNSFAPQIDVDISGEPLPGPPEEKRARH